MWRCTRNDRTFRKRITELSLNFVVEGERGWWRGGAEVLHEQSGKAREERKRKKTESTSEMCRQTVSPRSTWWGRDGLGSIPDILFAVAHRFFLRNVFCFKSFRYVWILRFFFSLPHSRNSVGVKLTCLIVIASRTSSRRRWRCSYRSPQASIVLRDKCFLLALLVVGRQRFRREIKDRLAEETQRFSE